MLTRAARMSVVFASLAFMLGASGVAHADCNADLAVLMNKRMSEITALNAISKKNGGKLDPVAGCPRLRSLAALEGQVVSYMQKNKDWCGLPDDLVEKMTAAHQKDTGFAGKACTFAAKMKQMQAEQQKQAQTQQEQSVKLPTGPL